MTDHNQELVERLGDEADLCRNDGATDIANLLDEARAAIAAAQSDGVWQPIETAPRDGTHILLATGDQVTIGRAVEDGRWFELNSDPTDYWDGELRAPDHWRPLPDPPALSAPEPVEEQKQ